MPHEQTHPERPDQHGSIRNSTGSGFAGYVDWEYGWNDYLGEIMSNSSSSSSGIGFVGLLTILFIGLKLTGYIAWSWWWVLSPVWISVAIWLVVLAVCFWIYMKA